MDALDRKILNKLQFEFPLDPQPYLKIAEGIGSTEDEVLERIGKRLGEEKANRG